MIEMRRLLGRRVNTVLGPLGVQVSRSPRPSRGERERYEKLLSVVKEGANGLEVYREPRWGQFGTHPENFVDHECAFAASHLSRLAPRSILDIGSYRHFIMGLVAHFPVTTVDVRDRPGICPNETVVTCDAKDLPFPPDRFDAVVSLCALEHIGLGRYGDEFDLEADRKAFAEMVRVLRPGAHLIFTTTINASGPAICFNAHRLYSHELLRQLCARLTFVDEKFFSLRHQRPCTREELTPEPGKMDVYFGCWRKP